MWSRRSWKWPLVVQRRGESAVARVGRGAKILLGFSLVLTLVLGVLSLWTPFLVDQAIFAYGARAMAEGETLYLDFWDIKPAGIFIFYNLAGRVTAFSEPGVHAMELLWQLAAAGLLAWIALLCVHHPAAAALAPLGTVGTYYAFATSEHLTQVEALMSLPITLALLAAFKLSQRPGAAGWSFLFGVALGCSALLKQLYSAIPASLALLLLMTLWRKGRLEGKSMLRMAVFGFLGCFAVWAPVVAYFAARGAMPEFLWVTFRYPTQALQDVTPAPTSRLKEALLWTTRVYGPYSPLILLGLAGIRRTRQPFLAAGTMLYLFLGALLIWVQRTSWWEYHQVLLFAPLGLLATLGLDRLLRAFPDESRRRRWAVIAAIVLLALPAAAVFKRASARVRQLQVATRSQLQAPLPVRTDRDYRRLWQRTEFLKDPESPPGPIYVFGDQRYLLLSGRRQAIAVRGHSWEHLPESMWRSLPEELMAAEPTYVFLSRYNRRVLAKRAPRLLDFLRTHYRPEVQTQDGRWWINTAQARRWMRQQRKQT